MKIVADAYIPFLKGALEGKASVHYIPGPEISRRDLVDASVLIIRSRTKAGPEILEGTKVKLVATATIGTDHLDIPYLEQKGIRWVHAPGCNASSVMQYVASALAWEADKRHFRFTEKTLGVIGVGHVGSRVVRMAEILGFRVLQNDPPRAGKEGRDGFVSIETLLEEADMVTLHVPLTHHGPDKTFHMVDRDFLNRIKPGTILINTSRGGVVKEADLIKSLESGKTGGAILDVWENEPAINTDLLEMTDLGTPHIAGYSSDGKANGTEAVVNAVLRFMGTEDPRWKISSLPEPGDAWVQLNGKRFAPEEILKQAVVASYAIEKDDTALRAHPERFERLRSHYPVRREFQAYQLIPDHCTDPLIRKLEDLGFTIKTNHGK